MNNRINSKDKQFAGGNWGHPRKFTKKHTNIKDPLVPEETKHKASKKYKEKKESKPFWSCPFCCTDLKKSKEDKEKDDKLAGYMVLDSHYRVCPNKECKAFEVESICPACKRDTWFLPDDGSLTNGTYKHFGYFGCGFTGRKRVV